MQYIYIYIYIYALYKYIYIYIVIYIYNILQNFGITACDDLHTGTQRFTYVIEALNSSSCIDHCFLSLGLHALVNNVSIIETAIN